MIATGKLADAWLYVLAPIVGAIIAAGVYAGLTRLARERTTAARAGGRLSFPWGHLVVLLERGRRPPPGAPGSHGPTNGAGVPSRDPGAKCADGPWLRWRSPEPDGKTLKDKSELPSGTGMAFADPAR